MTPGRAGIGQSPDAKIALLGDDLEAGSRLASAAMTATYAITRKK
jgi:hypothetical protein